MKICPNCQTKYTDDSLQFCLQDGTNLVNDESQTSMPTVVLSEEQQTIVRNRTSGGTQFETQNYPQQQTANYPTEQKKSNTALAIVVTVLAMLLIFAIGIAGWLYVRNKNEVASNQNVQNSSPNSTKSTVTPTQKPTAKPSASATATPNFDAEELKAEVAKALASWRAAAESINLDEYMTHYAPTVNYYNKKGADISFVKSDKAKAFSKYSKINFDISNMLVTIEDSGDNATVIIDKGWHFENEEKISEGKVKQQISMKRINGDWKITGEKDLKVYYKN